MVRAKRQLAAGDPRESLSWGDPAVMGDADFERRAMFTKCLLQVGAHVGDANGPGAAGCCRQQGLSGIRRPVSHGVDLGEAIHARGSSSACSTSPYAGAST